ncbi:MAG TPA: AAA family ATPase, partial [Nitrospira sp.]|nr:AAA family ATPase [Nitrospira sp.]
HLQHARGKHVVFVSILDERMDDFNRKVFVPQIEGAKTAAELPGIVDEVVTLAEMKAEDGSSYRAFVTQTMNPYGYPAKDRSGQLDLLEPPDLRALIEKCAAATQPKNSKE